MPSFPPTPFQTPELFTLCIQEHFCSNSKQAVFSLLDLWHSGSRGTCPRMGSKGSGEGEGVCFGEETLEQQTEKVRPVEKHEPRRGHLYQARTQGMSATTTDLWHAKALWRTGTVSPESSAAP